ncbi:MAG TPA: ABC transporter permease [Ktedonobacterales bacterium]
MAIQSMSPPTPRGSPSGALDGPHAASSGVPGVSPPKQRRRGQWERVGFLPALVVAVVALAIWQLITATRAVNPFLLPAPGNVLASFWQKLTDPSDNLLTYARTTLVESVAGCALGAAVALPLGYSIARSRLMARATQPYLAASQALPAVALAPLLALWLGYGYRPVIVLCALIVFFPMVITTVLGLRLLDRDILDAARVDGADRWSLLRHIELPLALPSILAGLRTSLTLSITGSVVGEFVVGGKGLGELLVIDQQSSDSPGVFATLLALALLAAALYGMVRLVERRLSYVEV